MVFKKLTDRLFSAGATATNAATNAASDLTNAVFYGRDQAEKIRQLESMGFPPERARHALNATDGDVDRAAELLLLGVDENDGSHNDNNTRNGNDNGNIASEGQHVAARNDEQMRQAIEESMSHFGRNVQEEEARQLRQAEVASMNDAARKNNTAPARTANAKNNEPGTKKQPSKAATKKPATKKQPLPTPFRSAAALNAGKAATVRQNGKLTTGKATLDHTHPNAQIPETLQNKSKEEQILRCANRMKPHSMTVDTLLRVLNSVKSSPDTVKFRTIDRTNGNYAMFVRDKPGAEDMLLAMSYRRYTANNKNELRLERHLVDDALLYLGISALEQVRESEEYKENKRWRSFHAEMRRVAENGGDTNKVAGMTETETAIRIGFLSKCPKEPPEGRGAIIHVYLGEEKEKILGGHVSRRFDGDDILEDVFNWLGGCYGSELLDRIKSGDWCLCDVNRYPILPLDMERHGKKTLQYLGLFPSGKLGVRLMEEDWKNGVNGGDLVGSARGLGAVSRSLI